MEFQTVARPGGFCLRRSAATCTRPFTVPLVVESLSGAAEETYCGIDQATTRCEAVLDLVASETCVTDEDCGCARDEEGDCTEEGAGGLCRLVGVTPNSCTIPCAVANHCPVTFTCTEPMPYCH
jgi:hypothetical protein